jgi:ABC-type polar amino acid transport system ATPase subunit
MICGSNVSLRHQRAKNNPYVLKKLSFELQEGRTTAFIGKSGAGKTTLLKCIGHLNPYYEGCITYQGYDLKKLPPRDRVKVVGFVLQQFHLFPHMTVLQNCVYALRKVLGFSEEEANRRSKEVLASLGMADFLNAYPNQLSGGPQQKVAICRSLAMEPKILLLDEPTSALDPESKKELLSILLELQKRGVTLGLSSHDMAFIQKIMDFVYFLEDGSIVEHWDYRNSPSLEGGSQEKIQYFLNHS